MAADLYRARLWVVEAIHQPHERRFARAASPDDAERLTFSQLERNVLQRGSVTAVIPESDVFECDVGLYLGDYCFRRSVGLKDCDGFVKDPKYTLRRG